MSTQERIRQALDDLATAPEPANLADRALRAAGRRRATTIVAVFGASAVAVALVAVGIAGLPSSGDDPAPPAGVARTPAPCVRYTGEVPAQAWPDFVTAALAALPARSDYVMQSGYGWCDVAPNPSVPETMGGWKISNAIINLGPNREHGVLTVDVFVRVPSQAATCAGVSTPQPLLFCTPGTPLVYAYGRQDAIIAIAVLGAGVEIRMPYNGNALTAQQVAAAASDPGLRQLVQDSLANLPT